MYLNIKSALQQYAALPCNERFRVAVIDDVLPKTLLRKTHQEILNHYGWRPKNWVSDHLYLSRPEGRVIGHVLQQLTEAVETIDPAMQLISHWCLLYRGGERLRFHSDDAALTINLWLTPDTYNLDHDGGLLISAERRNPDLPPHQYLSPERSPKLMRRILQAEIMRVSYRCNRAIIFDSTHFHRTDDFNFNCAVVDGYRINLSVAYDYVDVFRSRMHPYQQLLDNAS